MRRALIACWLTIALVVAACGDAEREPAAAPDDPVTSPADPAPPPPAGKPQSTRACRQLGRRIVGAELEAATGRAERRDCTLRVAVLDGEHLALTEDFQPSRINVRVDDGVVTGVEFMG